MRSPDILGELQPYTDRDIDEFDRKTLNELAEIFRRDVIDSHITLGDATLVVKPYKYSKREGLPDFYSNYNERFVHIITRKDNGSRTRAFSSERANRVHWIRPVLENHDDARITCFAFREDDGAIRNYYWYRNKMYIVVVENIDVECSLITGFCVDAKNKMYYQRKYERRIK